MIDAREYDSTEDLAAAMEYEGNVAKLEATRKRIEDVKTFIASAEAALRHLERDAARLDFKIRAYQQKVVNNGKNYK